MPRLHALEDVLFQVELQPLYVRLGGRHVRALDNQAVVEAPTGRVLGVVGRSYQLVSHAEALELAHDCARAVFPETHASEWRVGGVDAPATGSLCFIDLVHNSDALNFSGLPAGHRPELYGPFIRVTNSYNRTRALCFDIGYSRKVCSNGLIMRSALVSLRANHAQRALRDALRFEVAHDRLASQKQEFQGFLRRLRDCPLAAHAIADCAGGILGLHAPDSEMSSDTLRPSHWDTLRAQLEDASRRYVHELGANAYALLNVVTELASRPPDNPLVRRDRHALQRRAGEWLMDFASSCGDEAFDPDAYFALRRQAAAIDAARHRRAPTLAIY